MSFDTVADQAAFAEAQAFPYRLLSDVDRSVGAAYDADRGTGLPRRISYLIDPDGAIAESYDLAGQDLSEHAAVILADIAEHDARRSAG